MENEIMTAERITAPVITARILGEDRELRFDNRACMMAESYWREITGRRVSYFFILGELESRTMGGICAVVYGAMASAIMHANRRRQKLLPVPGAQAFEEGVSVGEVLALYDPVIAAVRETLPKEPKNGDGGGE